MHPHRRKRNLGLGRLTSRINADGSSRNLGDELPLRSELFSVNQLERHAEALADWHQIERVPDPDLLVARLADNERILLDAHRIVTEALDQSRAISPGGEWLLDNFYLIEEQIRTARRHLPKRYSRALPRLLNGPSEGYPRVYDLALELISHVDGRVDSETVRSFVAAYQRVDHLDLGELWAIPIMLRHALIENLRRVAARIATGTIDRNQAAHWSDRFFECTKKSPNRMLLAVADLAKQDPPLSSPFVAELARRLSGQSPALSLPLTWIEQRLWEDGRTIEGMVQQEGQQQAVDQVSIGNSINSLRELDATDWRAFVESQSVVEQTLLGDPAEIYGRMDFETRDHYRHVVEDIAKRSPMTEQAVARQAVHLARLESPSGEDGDAVGPAAHVGYFLVDEGLSRLERATRMRASAGARLGRFVRRVPLLVHVGAILLVSALVTAGLLRHAGVEADPTGVLAAALLFVGASHLGVAIVNWLVTLLVRPRRLPRMDFSDGIPTEFRTAVAVPTMLVDVQGVDSLLEGVEIRYLANRDDNLRFCLLTDFRDAPEEHLPDDDLLLQAARSGIESLNAKYATDGEDIFFLLHRPRLRNPRERIWMGRERKRGKLGDFNALLRQGIRDRFSLIVGDPARLTGIRFVITLDTDTLLPREAARQLAGTLAHPLNQPVIDGTRQVVTRGHGILQPSVATAFESGGQSWFARLHGGERGIDPYTRAVSDVYQDLFDEGSYIGKGIYDVDAFAATTEHRFPDDRILSHDLIEGCHARAGLVNDIVVYESHPSGYHADVSRRHRWIRGDWQIAAWILPFVPGRDGGFVRNDLCLLSRWKILDNLRRSAVPAALVALLFLGWVALPVPWLWTLVAAGILLVPALCTAVSSSLRKGVDIPWVPHLRDVVRSVGRSLLHGVLSLVFLAYEAHVGLDAVVRTLTRMLVSRRRMLEWRTASEAEREAALGLVGSWRVMWFSPGLAVAVAAVLSLRRPEALTAAAPLLVLWFLAPMVAWWISRPIREAEARLSRRDQVFLHALARRTWRFFEDFVGPEDNWLPPDNYQEEPVAAIAHRTSPTNIGVALLSNLAAYDFGFVSGGRLIERTENTLHTVDRLERFRGHLLNWYDTRTLEPLNPRYVSSVDSGNLSGHLLTLGAGLAALPRQSLVPARLVESLADMRAILAGDDGGNEESPRPDSVDPATLRELLEALPAERSTAHPPRGLGETADLLKVLLNLLDGVLTESSTESDAEAESDSERIAWLRSLRRQCRDHLDDLLWIAPWLEDAGLRTGVPDSASSLDESSLHTLSVALEELRAASTLHDVVETERHLPALDAIVDVGRRTGATPDRASSSLPSSSSSDLIRQLRTSILEAGQRARERILRIEALMRRCDEMADADYGFLYDDSRRLLAIGYNVTERRRDPSFYDLLASESRLASFVGIAQGHLKEEHWFALGRLATTWNGQLALLSWSGSMFEYLMPLLVMPTYRDTLLDQTCRAVVDRQIEYGRQRGVPWGISESGYNLTDAQLNYQYRAFGVPGLGFKRGLVEDLVIAPYATAMALMVAPERACENLRRMADSGFSGRYGFYEAVDYTRARVPRGQTFAIVRSYMAHHQGMSFLSLAWRLLDRPMQKRFQSDPRIQATELLLQERIPNVAPFYPHSAEVAGVRTTADEQVTLTRVFNTPATPTPEVHLLSNGRYHVMVTNAGGGYSSWKGLAVTRWQEDATRDDAGSFCYVRDLETGRVWSTAHHPTRRRADAYEAIFSQARAEFRRRDGDIAIHTEIAVSPEDDIEIRRSTITNYSKTSRTVEFTSYAEVVIAPPAADAAHPAFSNLFVRTEILEERQAILCTRRPRSHAEQPPWMLHLMAVVGARTGPTTYETDRAKFIGRCRTVAAPAAMMGPGSLSNSAGSVLDPIVAIRVEIALAPDETVSIDHVTGMADTRESAVALIDKYRDRHLADRVFDLAWTHGQVVLRQLNASEADALLFARLAGSVLYANSALRSAPAVLKRNQRPQSGLWGHGISGDLPIVLLRIADEDRIHLVRQLVQAHAYWRLKGLGVDLVIWNESPEGYRQVLHDLIVGLVAAGTETHMLKHPGGIFVRRDEQISEDDRILLRTVARAVIVDTEGTLAEQLDRKFSPDPKVPALAPASSRFDRIPDRVAPRTDLAFFNGCGGFTADGREYVIQLEPGQATPAPWVNVLANERFGSVVSESGGGYTWCENAHEFRLTPWYNDPVSDVGGEAFYLRDEDTGEFWSPTPLPARGRASHVCRHGFGYSVFEYAQNGIFSELWMYVAIDAPVKLAVLKVQNRSGRQRRLSATGYCEWVLGALRAKGLMHIVTEVDPQCGALLARNPYSNEFPGRIAFFDVNDPARGVTGDRTEFLGRNGGAAQPAAMGRRRLSGRVGAGFDPCAAVQTSFELSDGRSREIVFMLGAGRDVDEVRHLVQRFRGVEPARHALEGVWAYWNRTLGTVHVETPDRAVNILANGWLPYQTLACRYWARSGYYQSGGAFGFRDQLQDVAALIHAEPRLVREHLLRCAGRQFQEGDVQHWWHPPLGRGVRTHFSDDYLWLPLVVARYVMATGDTGVLDEVVPYLEGRPVQPEEEAYYDLPITSTESGSLYEHCVRAVTHGLRFGTHGLPLIGCGDWNDGMNRVGHEGRGESVWLAFFLDHVLRRFAVLARARGDVAFAERCESESATLRGNIERSAWDGEWYLRAFYDDGEPLGSAANMECRIDSIAQSWAVLSGAADAGRARRAMESVDEHLVRRDAAIIQLFDPPFDQSEQDPGYIKGYVPGVRENGGQYTHAAIWAVTAFARLGDRRRAWELFSLINPLNHGSTSEGIATYKVEPYVVAADVYAVSPHTGRGGWTWYTGSAGWMYRLVVESLLGLHLEVDRLRFAPCIPEDWDSFRIHYRYRETFYHITILQPEPGTAVKRIGLDGIEQEGGAIRLVDDHGDHHVEIELERERGAEPGDAAR